MCSDLVDAADLRLDEGLGRWWPAWPRFRLPHSAGCHRGAKLAVHMAGSDSQGGAGLGQEDQADDPLDERTILAVRSACNLS